MRRFYLDRQTDVSGTSGTGAVVEGVQFSDGSCIIRWLTFLSSMAVYKSIEDVIRIHGHDGATNLHWVDAEPSRWQSLTVHPARRTVAGQRLLDLLHAADAGPLADTLAADWAGSIDLIERESWLAAIAFVSGRVAADKYVAWPAEIDTILDDARDV